MADPGWERGDLLGHDLPVHVEALRAGGPEFLTSAFRASGALGPEERVSAITRLEPFEGGSTGRKAVLSVRYDSNERNLPEHLFVKLSRDLDDARRDRGKRQMESEVRFGLLSRLPGFPVAVPRCLFGEYHLDSGSGVLVSETIAFGTDGIEPHHPKARDWEVDDLLGHYDALVSALARLAGAHRAGRFPEAAMVPFEPRPRPASGGDRAPIAPDDVRSWVARYADFAGRCPQLLPEPIRTDAFLEQLRTEAPRSVEHASALRSAAQDTAEGLMAFCHWNANIDNAWFWRDEDGQLACGLMDWGNVGQVNVVTAISSCLTFAEPDFVVEHVDHLLARFAAVFEDSGGGRLDPAVLRRQLDLQMVSGGLRWPLAAVALIEDHLAECGPVSDRHDPEIADHEHARTQLHLLTTYLTLWKAADPGALIDWAVRRAEPSSSSEGG